ncbi:putative cytokinetic ring protein SteA [Nocardioides cynanchi]|uniref:putative cytokinetic ring protein SteA n=1 Tax=Nocardioides cynanchi TaxID=2558918 RepID=UPI001245AA15|nr:putative cytokinetic ring protein SteA [Nocardioides cynanchi]
MKLRTRPQTDAAGIVGTARTDRSRPHGRRTTDLLPRLGSGDIAVVDHLDLDGSTAEALVEAGVAAVLNQSAMISGRFPNRGPQILVRAGIVLVDQLTGVDGRSPMDAIPDGSRVRLHTDGSVSVDGAVVARGRMLSAADVEGQLTAARAGLATQLSTLTHTSAEFLRREEALLLHGDGVPRLRTRLDERPVVVVAQGPDDAAELRLLRRYLREVRPVVIAVAGGVEVARAAGVRPDVIVLDSRAEDIPAARELRAARDVVVTEAPGGVRSGGAEAERFERVGVRRVAMQTTAAPADAALLLADACGSGPIIAVGVRGTLEEFLDGGRDALASGYMTRLKVGSRLVDARAVPMLYSGQLRARHAYLVLLIGLLAVAAAIASTQVGHQWALDLRDQLHELLRRWFG